MTKTLDIEAIEARKKEIDDQIAELQKESEELDVTLRVARRFTQPAGGGSHGRLGPPRPDGIPTLFEMAYQVIREAEQSGKKGLPAKQIVEEIGHRYWPGVQGQQILAPLYGMAKKGRFRKLPSGLFQTVRTNEAPTGGPEGASRETGGVATP